MTYVVVQAVAVCALAGEMVDMFGKCFMNVGIYLFLFLKCFFPSLFPAKNPNFGDNRKYSFETPLLFNAGI